MSTIAMTALSNTVYSTETGQRPPIATGFELAALRATGNIRRPRVARHPWRLTCSPDELAAADAKRV